MEIGTFDEVMIFRDCAFFKELMKTEKYCLLPDTDLQTVFLFDEKTKRICDIPYRIRDNSAALVNIIYSKPNGGSVIIDGRNVKIAKNSVTFMHKDKTFTVFNPVEVQSEAQYYYIRLKEYSNISVNFFNPSLVCDFSLKVDANLNEEAFQIVDNCSYSLDAIITNNSSDSMNLKNILLNTARNNIQINRGYQASKMASMSYKMESYETSGEAYSRAVSIPNSYDKDFIFSFEKKNNEIVQLKPNDCCVSQLKNGTFERVFKIIGHEVNPMFEESQRICKFKLFVKSKQPIPASKLLLLKTTDTNLKIPIVVNNIEDIMSNQFQSIDLYNLNKFKIETTKVSENKTPGKLEYKFITTISENLIHKPFFLVLTKVPGVSHYDPFDITKIKNLNELDTLNENFYFENQIFFRVQTTYSKIGWSMFVNIDEGPQKT